MEKVWKLACITLLAAALVAIPVFAIEAAGEGGEIPLMIDAVTLAGMAATFFLGMGILSGSLGRGMAWIFGGISLFALQSALYTLNRFSTYRVFENLGDANLLVINSLLPALGFATLAYGFYLLRLRSAGDESCQE